MFSNPDWYEGVGEAGVHEEERVHHHPGGGAAAQSAGEHPGGD